MNGEDLAFDATLTSTLEDYTAAGIGASDVVARIHAAWLDQAVLRRHVPIRFKRRRALPLVATAAPRNPRRARLIVTSAVSASALAAVIIVTLVLGAVRTSPLTGAPASAATALNQSARSVLLAAANHLQTASAASTGRYWHTSVRSSGAFSSSTTQMDRWVAKSDADPTWFSMNFGHGTVLRKADPADSGMRTFDVEGRSLTLADIAALPTEPAALRDFLLAPYPADYQKSHSVQLIQRLFGEAADLALAPVDPAVRAAAYRLIAELPGVRNLGHIRDALGRSGNGLAISDGAVDHELIIDSTTGSVLDLQDVTRAPGGAGASAAGKVLIYQAILTSGWTDTAPQ